MNRLPVARRPVPFAACVAVLLWAAAAAAQEVPDLPADAGPPPAAANAGPAAPAAPAGADSDGVFLGLSPLALALQTGPFLIASLIALGYGVERLVSLRESRVIPGPFVTQFFHVLDSGRMDRARAEQTCEDNGSPVAEVFRHAVRKWGRPSMEVEQAVIDGGQRQVAHLKRNLRVLNAVATVTPLMGLLGTVIGMIFAFAKIADGGGAMGDADQLAAGIVTALLTTALGLTVAIPSLIVYFYLLGRVESLVMKMDDLADRVVREVAVDDDPPADPAPVARPAPRPAAAARPGKANRRVPVRADA